MTQGKRFYISGLNFVIAPNACNHARLGLAVSRKYGNAVRRNRLKRCIRNAFRQHHIREHGIDILVIPSQKLQHAQVSTPAITHSFDQLLAKVSS